MKEYNHHIDEESMKVSEPAVGTYRTMHSSFPRRSKEKNRLTAEEYARKICFTDEEFETLKAKGFYQRIAPMSEQYATELDEVTAMDEADEEGYVSKEEVEHLRTIWKSVKE
jgi:hypothetical protein